MSIPRWWPRRSWWLWAGIALIAAGAAWFSVRVNSPEARWRRIEDAIRARRWTEAEPLLSRWVERAVDDDRAWLWLGIARSFQERDEAALAALEHVREKTPSWPLAQGAIGEIHVRRHEAAPAERALRAAAIADPHAVDPRLRLVFLLSLERRPEEARAVLWELYRLDPQPRHLITAAGLVGVEADGRDLNPALEAFLERTPADPWLRRARGLTLLLQGRPGEALPHLEAAAAALEGDPTGWLALIECRVDLGLVPGLDASADSFLGPLPERPRDRASWWRLRSRLEEQRGRTAEALAALREAVAACPSDRAAEYRLGQALLQRGQSDQAQPYLQRAEAMRSVSAALKFALTQQIAGDVNAESFERMGCLCRDAGLAPEARAWFQQATRLDPARSTLQSALARLEVKPEEPPLVPRLRAHPRAPAQHAASPVAVAKRGAMSRMHPQAPVPHAAAAKAARAPAAPLVRFDDVAERSGLVFQYDPGATDALFIADTMGGGVALLDYDDDGWLDVYFVNGCPLPFDSARPPAPNKLFRNRGDGKFEDVTARAGVAGAGYGMGCAVGDYDNDGHDDLFVTGFERTVLYRNRGDGTFEDVTARAGVSSTRWTTAAGFGDFDGDGDLDLVVVTYVQADPRNAPFCRDHNGAHMHCPPAYFPDQMDLLFRNDGNGTFTNASREANIEVSRGPGLGLAIADFDGDGRLDFFVANDTAPCHLFRNLGGLRFEENGVAAGVAYDGNGEAMAAMGVVADDLDGDGLIDLFHTNFLEEPDTFLRNLGGGFFRDATNAGGLDAPSRGVTGWGTVAFDADNDGRLDLFVANGHLDQQPSLNRPMAQPQHLFLGRGGGRFVLAPESTGPYFARRYVARGVAAGDLDNDGRVDLVVVHRDAPASFLRNETPTGHWLAVRLRGTRSGRSPVGARVTCQTNGRTTVRWLTAGTSYLSSNDPRLSFGLGTASQVDRLEVRWPSGTVQSWANLQADRILEIREGSDPTPAAAPTLGAHTEQRQGARAIER